MGEGYAIQIYLRNDTAASWEPLATNWTSDPQSRALTFPLDHFAAIFVAQIPPPPVPTTPAAPAPAVRTAAICPAGPSTCSCGSPVTGANLRVGLRVARAPGWGYGEQDASGLGTVICASVFQSGWFQVQWDWADAGTWALLPSRLQGCNVPGEPCSERCSCTLGRNYYQTGDGDKSGDLVVASCDVEVAVWSAFVALQGVGGAVPMFWGQCLSSVAARAMLTPKPYLVIGAAILKEALIAVALARAAAGDGERRSGPVRRLCSGLMMLRALLKAVGGVVITGLVTALVVSSRWTSRWAAFNVWVFLVVHSSGTICTAQYFAAAVTDTLWTAYFQKRRRGGSAASH